MKRWQKITLSIFGILLAALLIVPFLIPVPPLEGLVPPEQLADPDSQFIDVNGLRVHYKESGSGELTFILLHGFAASTFSWREVMQPLAQYGRVIAFDRPAFGLTERPLTWEGANPYAPESQTALVLGMMDALGVERAILVGNSAGGTVAMQTYLAAPQRIESLILVDAAVYTGGGSPATVRWLFYTPQMEHLGPLLARRIQTWGEDFARSAWHDPEKITPQIWEGYNKPTRVQNWDVALWKLTQASRASGLSKQLDRFNLPVLVITGDDDRIVPTEQSIQLAQALPNAKLAVIPNCGHVPHEECPQAFMQAVQNFIIP